MRRQHLASRARYREKSDPSRNTKNDEGPRRRWGRFERDSPWAGNGEGVKTTWERGRPARTRPGTMEEIPVKAVSLCFARECRGWEAVCRKKDAGGTPALPGDALPEVQWKGSGEAAPAGSRGHKPGANRAQARGESLENQALELSRVGGGSNPSCCSASNGQRGSDSIL